MGVTKELSKDLPFRKWTSVPVGHYIAIPTHMEGHEEPPVDKHFRYIKLTAGLTEEGEYNEGVLTNESVSGSAPLVEATAEIATGTMAGETVHLLNTEESIIRPREASGELQFDATNKNHFPETANVQTTGGYHATGWVKGYGTDDNVDVDYSDWDSTGLKDETRAKNVSATFYMRIV